MEPGDPRRLSRRDFLGVAFAGGGALLASTAGLWWYATSFEHGQLEIVRQPISLRRLPRAFQGMTIAHLSDLHFGQVVDSQRLRAVVDAALALNPSIIVVTGDFVDRLNPGVADCLSQELSRLTAPLGTFAVLGNHDYWRGPASVAKAVRSAGVKMLRNTGERIELGGEAIYIVGLDDVRGSP